VSLLNLTHAQTLENINASFDGERVTVSYVLTHTEAGQKFKIDLYSSHDNYSQPISVTGDAGENVLPGTAKRVIWDAKSVLPSEFDGDIRIKIKATRMAAPKLVFEPLALKTYKKGRTISMKWTGGYPSDKVTIELYKNNVNNLLVAAKIDNSASYDWKMPKSVKGKNYMLRVSNATRPNEQADSQVFRVKPRTPFLVKFLPILAAGAAAVIVLGDDTGGEGPNGPTGDSVLPAPIKPGG
jgi:hypothetical protein